MNKSNRLKGGLYGLLIGDALGAPYEFHPASAIPPRELIDMNPPARFRRAYPNAKPGTWSQDGALALCLLASLLQADGLDPADLTAKFLEWEDSGYLAVDGRVLDIDLETKGALAALRSGVAPQAVDGGNGNGALVRALPLALWHRGSDLELVAVAHAQSLLTHHHVQSQVCCALYLLVTRRLLEGNVMSMAWQRAEEDLALMYAPPAESDVLPDAELAARSDIRLPVASGAQFATGSHAAALACVLAAKAHDPQGSGDVIDSLWSVRRACRESTFASVIKAAVALGNDTGANACLAGGLAGIHFGFDAIPLRWMDILRGRDLVKPLERRLLQRP
jgi:ADP-ribosyl-[dinitrogen reductase] hydrolase